MKLMIASDLHGSAYYCKELLRAYRAEQPDKLLLLGDLLYHGPRNDLPLEYAPKEVIELLNGSFKNILCVRGNCEAEVDQMVLQFPVMADYAWICIDGLNVFATHGHLHGEHNPPPLQEGDLLLCGHTHVPAFHKHENYTYVNPGSLSIPKEGSPHSYMVLENKELLWKNLGNGEIYRRETV
jgi:putative phosphoesterase